MDGHEPGVEAGEAVRVTASRRRRRLAAGVAVVVALAASALVGASLLHGKDTPPPPTTTAPALENLRVIFPEGFTRADMANRVAAVRVIAIRRRGVTPRLTRAGYLRASAHVRPPREFRKYWGGRSIEGFLFPATYDFTQYTPAAVLVQDQLAYFQKEWGRVDLRYARSKNLTPYDVLVIASMIEKEAAVPGERRLVAAVIYNRLHARMPLGIDATIRYGRHVPGNEPLRLSDLESSSPYNTRNRLGLPPTPISNPGLASIRAAAHPARVDYLYYVRKPNSLHHSFTASASEFLQKKCEYGYGC